jgi:glycosyltransferase involved in cell wall biosynthesis
VQIPDLPQRLAAAQPTRLAIDVVVCTYRRPRELERCLESLRRQAHAPDSIVVVDNAPSSPAARHVAQAAGARYVASPVGGVSRARNAGARHCGSPIVAYIDDDMTAHPGWLAAVAESFADPVVAAVTGPVLPLGLAGADDDAHQRVLLHQPWGSEAFSVDRDATDWFERAHFGGLGDGNMAFRRAIFSGGLAFEERIGRGMPINGGEEHYAFFGVLERGHRVAYAPRARVFHVEQSGAVAASLKAIEDCGSYAAFLMANHPRYAWRVLRFLVQAALGKKRPWRGASAANSQARVGRAAKAIAFSRGLAIYRRARRQEPGPAPARRLELTGEND